MKLTDYQLQCLEDFVGRFAFVCQDEAGRVDATDASRIRQMRKIIDKLKSAK